jgi:hypothetical protein
MSTPTSTSPPAAAFDNASIADVLSLAGISDSAVTAFIEVHTTALRPMSMAKFLSNLRSIGDDTTLVPELFSRRFCTLVLCRTTFKLQQQGPHARWMTRDLQ